MPAPVTASISAPNSAARWMPRPGSFAIGRRRVPAARLALMAQKARQRRPCARTADPRRGRRAAAGPRAGSRGRSHGAGCRELIVERHPVAAVMQRRRRGQPADPRLPRSRISMALPPDPAAEEAQRQRRGQDRCRGARGRRVPMTRAPCGRGDGGALGAWRPEWRVRVRGARPKLHPSGRFSSRRCAGHGKPAPLTPPAAPAIPRP